MRSSKNHIPSIDGLRAVAVLFVVLSHLSVTRSLTEKWNQYIGWFIDGKTGVDIFFIISGFLITLLLLTEREKYGSVNLKNFYIRRVLRIFPAFYCYLGFILILSILGQIEVSSRALLASALYIYNFNISEPNWYVNHSWSLGVEEQFYILFPVFILRLKLGQARIAWIISLIVGSAMRALYYKFPENSSYFLSGFFLHADFLATGCYIGFLYSYKRDWLREISKKMTPIIPFIAIAAILLVYSFQYHPVLDIVLIPLGRTSTNLSIGIVLIYYIFPRQSPVYDVLNASPMTWLGRLSYSLYLWQQYFISGKDKMISSFPQNLAILFVVSIASYYLIERPFLLFKSKFTPDRDIQ
ncbi:acyltransferase [Chryseolinea sp. T2]|uniref:acyltransferase family protein n=1 Tax=Chryseolinea sp. T2 TaxID=3129255 RepID=UPI00307804B4